MAIPWAETIGSVHFGVGQNGRAREEPLHRVIDDRLGHAGGKLAGIGNMQKLIRTNPPYSVKSCLVMESDLPPKRRFWTASG